MSQHATLVCLIGPPAVGKMTVGQELEHRTGFPLFYNHQVIDLLTAYFPFGSPAFNRLEPIYRTLLIEEAAASGLSLIVTSARRWTVPDEKAVLRSWLAPYLDRGHRVAVVELTAPLAVRLERHHSEHRHRFKRLTGLGDDDFRHFDAENPWNWSIPVPTDLPFLRLETEHLTAGETAQRIADYFRLT